MRQILKKTRIIALVMMILFDIASCGGDSSPTENAGSNTENTAGTQITPDKADSQQSDSSAGEDGDKNSESELQTTEETDDADPFEFVRNLKIGWNLGNTFDAMDCTWLSNELDYESAWNGQKTSEELIQAIKDAGFQSVRIPVSWHNHLSDPQKYTISQPWLDRVNTVVDYCIDRGMYVIINIHHDNDKQFLYPDSEHLDQSVAYVTAIWEQLSEHFKDYDTHLIFEGMNEPRLVGHTNEWWIDNDNAECRDAIRCINTLNQTFVDTVRASGGNNTRRYLMCPGYDASPDGALNSRFTFPKDPVKSNNHRIILAVHSYNPYSFALELPGISNWSSQNSSDASDLVWFMDQLEKNFIKKGIPVVIDEFGSVNKSENVSDRVDHASSYIAAAKKRGMTCFWWDNNAFTSDGENFGLIDRASCTWKYPEIVEAMMNALNE